MQFQLIKILDPLRDDFKVINPNYKNIVIFTYKREPTKVFGFNFCTLLFYELKRVEIKEEGNITNCYKIYQTLHGDLPFMFISYEYHYRYRPKQKPILQELTKYRRIA